MNWMMLGGSLAGVLMLAAVAWALKLGGDARIENAEDALRIAGEHGFAGVDAVIEREGLAAAVRDAEGRTLRIRRHGAHFVANLDA